MFLAGYMYGPISAIVVNLIKFLVKLPLSTTACVGEIGDFIFSLVFVLPAVILYQKRRKLSSVFIGFGISTFVHVLFAMIMNVYFMIPFYSMFYNLPLSVLESMCSKVVPAVQGDNWIWMYAGIMVAPMNIIKDAIVVLVVLLLYKRLHILIDKIASQVSKKKELPIEENKEEVIEN
jgi:riboflavin transporter FmnP